MKHPENKSQVWFKILTQHGESLENENEKWQLPQGVDKADWFTSPLEIGTWLVTNPKDFILKTNRVFVAELDKADPLVEKAGIIWVRKVRLVREATNLELKRFGIYRAFGPIF